MQFMSIRNGRFYLGDCLKVMKEIPDGVIDMVLCDLPYGTTQNKWDSIIPFEELWREYWRICKPNAAIVLAAAQPFTSVLVSSQIGFFKYDWVWHKEKGTGHLNAKKMPMRDKEDILVFYKEQCIYNPQFEKGTPFSDKRGRNTESYGKHEAVNNENKGVRYPKQVLKFNSVGKGGFHPTQKPVELFEYLIKTYTNEGDLVLDNTAGSGTTAIAAENTGRKWVCIEQNEEYATKAVERIRDHEVEPQEKLISEITIFNLL
jgi:site-specific DNA-methyltransferase (adenine-specific)